ncbi:MAG: dipeptide ABC transporter ATP-binding protein [Acidocella sp.]|uniref:dipeptide ABC transporter ATP-binding protein n=1 Tax=Acidocella sp. TaxID=50710 RepID=UPI003FBB2E2E
MSLLTLDNLTVSLGGRELLHGVSLSLASGEALALVGESGSGKSLTALAIAGLLPEGAARQGRILFQGEDLAAAPEARLRSLRGAKIGFVFQEPMTALNPVQPVLDQVAEVFQLHRGLALPKARNHAIAALSQVELPSRLAAGRHYPHELSGGQRQRVAIAMALALNPALIIADEPTTALDPVTEAQILALLTRLARESGAGLLFISHNLPAVARVAGRIAVMARGEIVETGPVALLSGGAAHPVTRALIAADRPEPPPANVPGDVRLAVDGVSHVYPGRRGWLRHGAPVRALEDVSFTLAAGECVGLIGESGSGKSTLLRGLLGLQRLSGGDIRIDGISLNAASAAEWRGLRRKLQIVFQDPATSFDPRWRISDIIAEPLGLLGQRLGEAAIATLVADLLAQVGLSPSHAGRYPHQLSGGQRQRVAIARALAVNPEILVLDEATSALDATVKAQILALLVRLARERRLACLFVTHDLDVLRAVADRVIVLEAGRIVEDGPAAQVLAAPCHAYTAKLIAAAPGLDAALRTAHA